MTAAGECHGVKNLPDGGLILREGAGGRTELLKSGEREEGQCCAEGGVGGNAGDAERTGSGIAERGAGNRVAAPRVTDAEIIQQMRRKGMRLVEDSLLAEDVGEAGNSAGADDCAGESSAAVGQRGDRLLDFVVVGVAAKGTIAAAQRAIDADVELGLMIRIVRGSGVIVGGGLACGCRETREQSHGRGIERDVDYVVGKLLADVHAIYDRGGSRDCRSSTTPVKMPLRSLRVGMVEMRVTPMSWRTPW